MPNELSPTMLDYLAEVYRLGDRTPGYVNTSALADLMGVSAPAVNRMVTRLKELGLLEHEPYQGIRLTPDGAREALKHIRRQRIAEAFLVKVMGFGWHEVYSEAQAMSATLSEALVARMWQMAGQPAACPHGEPIPAPDGTLTEMSDFPLATAPINADYLITRVRSREPDRLEYLAALGLLPGTRLHLLHIAPFNGPLQLRLAKEFRIIGHNLAEMVLVKPA